MGTELDSVLKINLHNHTTFSDGTLLLPALIGVAVEEYGLDVVGITDHFMTEKVGSCVTMDNLPQYLKMIRERSAHYLARSKYILAGIELDLCSEFLQEPMNGIAELAVFDLDYFLVEGIHDKSCFERLTRLRRMLAGKPFGLAHWNVREVFSVEEFIGIIPGLIENNIFIEVTSGAKSMVKDHQTKKLVPYFEKNIAYYREFVNRGGMISLGTDTHFRVSDIGDYNIAYEFFWKNELQQGIIRFIDYLRNEMIEGLLDRTQGGPGAGD